MDNKSRAKRYENIKLSLSVGESVLTFVLIVLFVVLGYSLELRETVFSHFDNDYTRFFAFIFILGGALSLISFPLDYISGFWLEHHYDLSNQTFGGWLWEKLKGLLIGLFVMIPLMFIFYYLLKNFPSIWWVWLSVFLFFFSVILGKIAPIVIFPLFYKFIPLDNEELLKRMNLLAEGGNFSLDGIFRFDLSKTTKKANAAFTGMGKTKRIILGDTLLENFNMDEIEAVFAHEVGHYVHKHIYIGIFVSTISSFLSFYLANYFYVNALSYFPFNGIADPAALPLLFLILTLITLLITPFSNALSRHHERQADRYALGHIEDTKSFKTSMLKLSELNLSNQQPHPLIEFFFYSHPSIKKRVTFAENYINETQAKP
jgi:STE24 endopeptidase